MVTDATTSAMLLPEEFNLLDYWLKVGSQVKRGEAKPPKQEFYGRKQWPLNSIAPLYTHLKPEELTGGRGG